jgi:hypothetical protein
MTANVCLERHEGGAFYMGPCVAVLREGQSDPRVVTILTQWHYFSLGPAAQLDLALPRTTSQLSRTFAW